MHNTRVSILSEPWMQVINYISKGLKNCLFKIQQQLKRELILTRLDPNTTLFLKLMIMAQHNITSTMWTLYKLKFYVFLLFKINSYKNIFDFFCLLFAWVAASSIYQGAERLRVSLFHLPLPKTSVIEHPIFLLLVSYTPKMPLG